MDSKSAYSLYCAVLGIIFLSACASGPTRSSFQAQTSFRPEVYATTPADYSRGYNNRADAFRANEAVCIVVANWKGSSIIGKIRLFRDGQLNTLS